MEELALKIVARGEGGIEVFFKKLNSYLDSMGVNRPTLAVRYKNLTVEADALVGSAGLPTLANTFRSVLLVRA